jgi:hypothetical protein
VQILTDEIEVELFDVVGVRGRCVFVICFVIRVVVLGGDGECLVEEDTVAVDVERVRGDFFDAGVPLIVGDAFFTLHSNPHQKQREREKYNHSEYEFILRSVRLLIGFCNVLCFDWRTFGRKRVFLFQ